MIKWTSSLQAFNKTLGRVIDQRRRKKKTHVSENQFGFLFGRSTTKAIYLLGWLTERCREKKNVSHMVFIDFGKRAFRYWFPKLCWIWGVPQIIFLKSYELFEINPSS